MGRPEMKCYTGWKDPDESSAEILALLALSRNGKDVMGNVDCLRDEVKGNQKELVHLKEEMSSKTDEGFKKEQHTRQQIQSETVSAGVMTIMT